MGWGTLRIVEHLAFYDGPTRQNVAWLVYETVSSSMSDVVCVKLLHGGGEGETETADFSGIIQYGAPSNST
jgi:hypothetical protein